MTANRTNAARTAMVMIIDVFCEINDEEDEYCEVVEEGNPAGDNDGCSPGTALDPVN